MTGGSGDAAFVQFAADQRATLLGVAYLMYGQRGRAEDVVEATLAELYRGWPGTDPQRRVLRRVLDAHPGRLGLPWRQHDRVQLLDAELDRRPTGIVADLSELDDDVRRVVIARCHLGLPPAEVAALLALEVDQVAELTEAGRRVLAEGDGDRRDPQVLSVQLRQAAGDGSWSGAGSGASDLRHGRLLVRRRRLRTLLVAAVALLAVPLAVTQVVSASAPLANEPAASAPPEPPAAPPTPTARATCDTTQPYCRLDLLRDWRGQMAAVIRSSLDPGNDYFSGYAYNPKGLSTSEDFWQNRGGGALSLDVVRRGSGGTKIYLQVATSRPYALRCGDLTGNRCTRQNFLDGYTYNLTETTTASQGIEVQLSLRSAGVITVAARATPGRQLDVTRADLMELATDPRLRLPPR